MSGPSDIAPIILTHKPGDKITITYSDASGQTPERKRHAGKRATAVNRSEKGARLLIEEPVSAPRAYASSAPVPPSLGVLELLE